MCYLVLERYSICRCLYYKHSVDMCAAYGQQGHDVAERTVLVGYTCDIHSDYYTSRRVLNAGGSRHLTSTALVKAKKNDKPPLTAARNRPQLSSSPATPTDRKASELVARLRSNLKAKKNVNKKEKLFSQVQDNETLQLKKELEGLDLILLDGNDSDSDHSMAPSQIWTEPERQAASTSTTPAVDVASAELVSLLVEHPGLKDLYGPAIAAHGAAEFRESLCLVLKAYAKALKSGSSLSQEYKAGELVRSYARRVAHACVAFHDPSIPSPDVSFRWGALHRQKIQAAARVEDYLNNQGKQPALRHIPENNVSELSDDSDREATGDPLPNLSKVTAYMTSGAPFDQLCRDVLHLSSQKSRDSGTPFVKLQRSLPRSKTLEKMEISTDAPKVITKSFPWAPDIRFLMSSLCWLLGSDFTPQISLGCTRLNWFCDCGAALFEDYATTDPEIISKLSMLIKRPTVATVATSPPNSTTDSHIRTESVSTSSTSISFSSPPSYDTSVNESTHFCQDSNAACNLCTKRLTKKFLALCINTGRFHKTLGEIDVTNTCRDSDAFRQIKARYLEVRSFRARARRLFLLRPNRVHFVKINIEDTFRADIVENPSIPPHTEVHAKRYDYSPLDLPLPPITSNSFLHYLENPECESLTRTSRWLSCLPKRLEEQLLSRRRSSEPNTIVSGWGIHIDEALNEEALAILVLMILIFSATVGIAYSVKTGDTSSGFTIAGYIATVMGVLITVLYYRWQHG